MKAPIPAKVPWHSESWPAMPVISVTESRMIERVSPLLKTVSHVIGIQVSMETMNAAKRTHHRVRMMRSMLGALAVAAIGGGGGSIVASGSRLESRLRIPGRKRRAAAIRRNGSAGRTAALRKPLGGV